MDWSCVDYLWIIVMFLSQLFGFSFWRHPFTDDPLVSKSRNAKFPQTLKKLIYSTSWPEVEYIFSSFTVFFKLLTSFLQISSHIFKTLNTISTKSIFCDNTINAICVVFTQYLVNYHVSKILKFYFHSSLLKTKIMDLLSLFYKCLNTACQKLRPNVSNLK